MIKTDRLTLDSQATAVLSGTPGGPVDFNAVLTVDSARGVSIKGLTVQNSPAGVAPPSRCRTHGCATTLSRVSTSARVDGDADPHRLAAQQAGPQCPHECQRDPAWLHRFHAQYRRGADQRPGRPRDSRGEGRRDRQCRCRCCRRERPARHLRVPVLGRQLTDRQQQRLRQDHLANSRFNVYPAATVTISNDGVLGTLLVGGGAFITTLPGGGTTFVIDGNAVGVQAQMWPSLRCDVAKKEMCDRRRCGRTRQPTAPLDSLTESLDRLAQSPRRLSAVTKNFLRRSVSESPR